MDQQSPAEISPRENQDTSESIEVVLVLGKMLRESSGAHVARTCKIVTHEAK